jgi:transposase
LLNQLKLVGIDLNSKEHVCSDGTRFEVLKFLKENQFKIKKLQRELSKKQKDPITEKKYS